MNGNAERRPPARKAAPPTNHDQAILPQNLEIGRGSTSRPALVREVPSVWADHFTLIGQAYRRGYEDGRRTMSRPAPNREVLWAVIRTGADLRPYSSLFSSEREARQVAANARHTGRYAHVSRVRLPDGIERVGGGER